MYQWLYIWSLFLMPIYLFLPFYEQQMRLSLLMASSVLQGASIGPLIELAIEFDPRYLFHPPIFIFGT